MFRISNLALAVALTGLSSTQSFAPSSAFGVQRYSAFQNDIVAKQNFLVANTNTHLFMASDVSESVPTKLVRKPDSNVELTLTASGKSTKAAYDAACAEMSKSLSIPGFRKGAKIPAPVIENAVAAKGGKNALRTQAIQTLLNQMLEPALKDEHNLEPIGQPTLVTPTDELAEKFKPGEPIEIVVACDVWPDIKWKEVEGKEKPYIGLTGKYTRKPFNQARLDQALKDLAERYASTEPAPEGKVLEMGDACIVDMEGYMAAADGVSKGEPLPAAASGDNVEVVLGPGRYMEGLVEGLVGAKVGETKTVYVSFPTGLRDKTLAGKKAIFDVTVKESNIRTVPEINDELAAKIRPGLDAEGLIQELRKAVDEQDIAEWTQPRNKALAKALAEVMDVEVPDTLVTNQAREKYAQMMAEFRTGGMADEEIKKQITPENFLKYKNIEKADIIADFKTSMAVDEIARIENIQVPEYQIDEQLEALKKEAAGEDLGDEGVLRTKIESTISRRLVFDFLADNSNLTVEYSDEPEIDEELLEQLAQDTLKREEEMATKAASNQE
jgi:trigger factor